MKTQRSREYTREPFLFPLFGYVNFMSAGRYLIDPSNKKSSKLGKNIAAYLQEELYQVLLLPLWFLVRTWFFATICTTTTFCQDKKKKKLLQLIATFFFFFFPLTLDSSAPLRSLLNLLNQVNKFMMISSIWWTEQTLVPVIFLV